MVEVFSLILIPTIARYSQEWKNGTRLPPHLEPPQKGKYSKMLFSIDYYIKYCIYLVRCWYANRQYVENYAAYGLPNGFFEKEIRSLLLLQYKNGINQAEASSVTNQSTTSNIKELSSIPDSNRDDYVPFITTDFVYTLLIQLGEYEHANNEELLNDMVQVAQSKTGLFDEEAFMNAISSDLDDFPTNLELNPNDDIDEKKFRQTSFFEDIFQVSNPQHVMQLHLDEHKDDDEEEGTGNFNGIVQGNNQVGNNNDNTVVQPTINEAETRKDDCSEPPVNDNDITDKKSKTNCPFLSEPFNIDLVVDSHGSLVVVVLIWMFYMLW
jgi:hypothetical protein